MYGVVLWSDPEKQNAVIWCEDHGDLAFFQGEPRPELTERAGLDAGDYVSFDLHVEDDMRRAVNAKTVEIGTYEYLPEALTRAAHVPDNPHLVPVEPKRDNRVVPLTSHHAFRPACAEALSHHG